MFAKVKQLHTVGLPMDAAKVFYFFYSSQNFANFFILIIFINRNPKSRYYTTPVRQGNAPPSIAPNWLP